MISGWLRITTKGTFVCCVQMSVPEVAGGFGYYVEQSQCSPRRKYLRRRLLGENIGQEEIVLDEAELIAKFGDLVSIHQVWCDVDCIERHATVVALDGILLSTS